MAVSGADWRKSTDGYRTDEVDGTRPVRSRTGRSPAAADSSTREGNAVWRILADNTDRSDDDGTSNTVETNDTPVSAPLAIEVVTETAIVTERLDGRAISVDAPGEGSPSGRYFDGDDIYLRYFIPDPGTRPRRVIDE